MARPGACLQSVLVVLALLLGACAGFHPQPLDDWPDPALVHSQQQGQVTVSAGILSDERAEQIYGADLVLKLARELFQKSPNKLDPPERKRVDQVAARQSRIEQRILETREAVQVIIPVASLDRVSFERKRAADAQVEATIRFTLFLDESRP